jgi:hypothetical protein
MTTVSLALLVVREVMHADCPIVPEEDVPKLMAMGEKFIKYAPHYTGQASPEEAVKDVLNVIQKSSLENGAGGSYVSHFGTKQWL